MSTQSLALDPMPAARPAPAPREAGAPATYRLTAGLSLLLFLASALYVHQHPPFRPAEGLGYALGIVGGILMSVLLLYPLRKRFRSLQVFGALKHWFRFHMIAGIAGPLSILYHSTFHIGSFNAAIALYSMLLVVASGVVGRFIYRKIHHGLFGSRATLSELKTMLERQLSEQRPLLARYPAIAAEIEQCLVDADRPLRSPLAAARHLVLLSWRRLHAQSRLRRALAAAEASGEPETRLSRREIEAIIHALGASLAAAQRTAQFAGYERLFALWHVIHIPFLWMLFITAIIHVVAVHAY